jgi:broad specificity phosphatase PhoE
MANRLLYLARHGESEATGAANPEDGELTEAGRQQSELLGKRLQGIPFAAIHHSPWTRAVQTAAIVAERLPGIPLVSLVHPPYGRS